MRTLIYKRTHTGDPDPERGVFGESDCMGEVRNIDFDNVIGVGGISREPQDNKIARRLTWVGINSRKLTAPASFRGPLVAFDCFWCPDRSGPPLHYIAPTLAKYIYETNRRYIVHSASDDSSEMDEEIRRILQLAHDNAASIRSVEGLQQEAVAPVHNAVVPAKFSQSAFPQSVTIITGSRSARCSTRNASE